MARDWLIALRTQKGLSQKCVAELAGMAQPSYCTIEKGTTNPRVQTAKAITEVLDFDWTRFYC